jgi:hypothetical protein
MFMPVLRSYKPREIERPFFDPTRNHRNTHSNKSVSGYAKGMVAGMSPTCYHKAIFSEGLLFFSL